MSLNVIRQRTIAAAIELVKKAETRFATRDRVKEAGDLIKRELDDSKQRMAKAMQTCVEEQKELLALLHELNEVTKQQVDRLKPEEHHP